MGEFVFKNAKIYSGSYDISGSANTIGIEYAYDEVPVDAFGDACHHALPGFPKLGVNLEGHGYSDGTDEIDDVLYAYRETQSNPLTVAPLTGAAGEFAYFAETLQLGFTLGGSAGDVYAYTATGMGENTKLVRGQIMGQGTKTSTANGTAYQTGAVGATQYLYGCLHVYSVSGTNPTLDVVVASDDAEGFASGTTRLTFTQKTAIGSQFITPVAGAITDDWWRATWTIGGTDTPTFGFIVTIGIL